MIVKARYVYRDFNGQDAESGYSIVDAGTIQSIDDFVISNEGRMSGISSALLLSASYSLKTAPPSPGIAPGLAPIRRRLYVLCRTGENYAQFVLPAASFDLPVVVGGPYDGLLIDKASGSSKIALIDQLVQFLGQTVTPDGRWWPVEEWKGYVTE